MRLRSSHRKILVCTALSLSASITRAAHAQRVLGIGDDATVLPRGAVRFSAQASWSAYNELYGPGGKLEALGAPLSADSLGARQLEILRPIETSLRVLAQLPTANVTLGPARTDFTARVQRTAFTFDLGLTSRIMLTARVPYERTTSEVVFDVNPRNVSANRANIGVNPVLTPQTAQTSATRNRSVVDAVLAAATQLSTRLAACATTPTDPVCADRDRVQTLVTDARTFANGVAHTYGIGVDTAQGMVFVPLAASTLQTAVAARVTALNASFKTYLPQLPTWETPAAAQAPITVAQANPFLSEALGVDQIAMVQRSHIGDIELGAKLLLIDTFGGSARARAARGGVGFRLAVGGLVRLGTGQPEVPTDLVDVGTGDGQRDVEGNGAADLVIGRRFWTSFVARVGVQMADERLMRIPDVPRNPFVAAYREQLVNRDLGDYVQFEATPRYVYNDYLSLSAQWVYRRKAEDSYSGTFRVTGPDGTPVTLDASVLGIDTRQTGQRLGGGVTFSTLRAFDRGRAGLPIEVSLLHSQVMSGSGYLPKQFDTRLQLRYYTRLFGAPLRPRTPAATRPPG